MSRAQGSELPTPLPILFQQCLLPVLSTLPQFQLPQAPSPCHLPLTYLTHGTRCCPLLCSFCREI